ncbi:septum formation initiator [Opitutaceae bacterium EW11]|nr:septum formation initiator [Opitutaceae bacterium EW11]
MTLRRLIIAFYLLLFLSLAAGSGVFFLQTKREYTRLQQMEAQSKVRLAEAEQKLREQERVLERLRTDPAYVEMIIRQRLGYSKPDEYIFRFEKTPYDR